MSRDKEDQTVISPFGKKKKCNIWFMECLKTALGLAFKHEWIIFSCHNRHTPLVMGAGLDDNELHVSLLYLLRIPRMYRLPVDTWRRFNNMDLQQQREKDTIFIHASQINIGAPTLLVIVESDLMGRKCVTWKCYITVIGCVGVIQLSMLKRDGGMVYGLN